MSFLDLGVRTNGAETRHRAGRKQTDDRRDDEELDERKTLAAAVLHKL